MKNRYLSRKEASAYLQAKGLPCAPATLAKLATIGGGPNFRKWGRKVTYSPADLDAWISKRLSDPKSSTCDYGHAVARAG